MLFRSEHDCYQGSETHVILDTSIVLRDAERRSKCCSERSMIVTRIETRNFHIRDVGSIQKVGGGTCIQRHPHVQKRALCKLKRGTLLTNL